MKSSVILICLLIAVSKTMAYLQKFRVKQAFFHSPSIHASYRRVGRDGPESGLYVDTRYFKDYISNSHFGRLGMGGYNSYYVESDSDAGSDKFKDEIGGRKIDRSKTHMIFGVRCAETSHKLFIAGENQIPEINVVGLQPLSDLEDESSDGMICIDDMDEGDTLSVLLGFLRSEFSSDNDDFELLEVGADPIVSIAAPKLIGGTVVVQHPDEQRLRVLEHAHLYFNDGSNKNPSCFQTIALEDDQPVTINSSCDVVLFTSPELVSSRLEDAVGSEGRRILVPSAMVSEEQLEKYDYRIVVGADSEDDSGSRCTLLEILSPK